MPAHELELAIITRTLDDETHLAEALFFPSKALFLSKMSRYGNDAERLKRAIPTKRNAHHYKRSDAVAAATKLPAASKSPPSPCE